MKEAKTKDFFTNKEISELTQISTRQISHLSECGAIVAHRDSKGQGTFRLYNRLNLFEFLLVKHLRDGGVRFSMCKSVMQAIHNALRSFEEPEHERHIYPTPTELKIIGGRVIVIYSASRLYRVWYLNNDGSTIEYTIDFLRNYTHEVMTVTVNLHAISRQADWWPMNNR